LRTEDIDFLSLADEKGIDLQFGYNPLSSYTCPRCNAVVDVITDKCKECGEF
jgi:hypothetical protein